MHTHHAGTDSAAEFTGVKATEIHPVRKVLLEGNDGKSSIGEAERRTYLAKAATFPKV